MKQQLNESKRMQQLAGIQINENIQDRADAINSFARTVQSTEVSAQDIADEFKSNRDFPEESNITVKEMIAILKKYGKYEEVMKFINDKDFIDPAGGRGLSSYFESKRMPQLAGILKEDEQSDSKKYKVGDILNFKDDGEQFIVTKVLPKQEKLFARPNDENTIKKYVKMDQEMTFDELENKVEKLQKIAGVNEIFDVSPEKINRKLEDALDSWVNYHMESNANEKEVREKGFNMVRDAIDIYAGGKINSDDLEDQFDDVMSKENSLSEKYVIPKEDEIDDDEDPLYQELANEIGEKKLQKLLSKGWEIDDIAEDPQGAAASIK